MTGVGILGATGKTSFAYIAQRSMQLLEGHPFLEVRALIADDPADVGKSFAEAVQDRWMLDEAIPENWAGIRMIGTDAASLRDAGVTLVLSALSGPLAKELDPKLAAEGFGVISESIGLRQEPDVPLVVPEVNADHLRLDADAVDLVRDFFAQHKPVGAICHAAWILIEADVVSGRTLTSYPSLKTDLRNAGATWVDEEVIVDEGLVSSRTPDDLPAFNAKVVEEIDEGRHSGQTA